MAKKKELDNLSLDMIQCKADGFGCHYGQWKALNGSTKVKEEDSSPQGWLICQYCGKPFKPNTRRLRKYCDAVCQRQATIERNMDKKRAYSKAYQERKREEERKLRNESCVG